MPRFNASAAARFSRAAGLLLCLAGAPALGQAPDKYRWQLEDTIDGCQLSASKVAGKDYVAAKSTCVFPANIEVVGAVLRDIESYPEWMEDCTQTKMLKVIDRDREMYIFWFRQHIPVFTDRDMVLKSELAVNEAARRVVQAALTADVAYDSGKGYIRMPSFSGEWLLEKIDEGQTHVTYRIDPDLGPGLPVGIANSTIKEIPFKSIRRMMKRVKLQKYLDRGKGLSTARSAKDVAATHMP